MKHTGASAIGDHVTFERINNKRTSLTSARNSYVRGTKLE